jgi:AcrR family transcriptional regulator
MVEKGRRPGNRDTRTEIIEAARRVFGQVGYDRASLRAIASEAGVDPALIHHYFEGGKPILFAESMHLGRDPHAVVAEVDHRAAVAAGRGSPLTLGQAIVAGFLGMWDSADAEAGSPAGTAFVTFVQAASASPAAADAVREFLAERIWSKAAANDIPAEHRLRNQSLVASQLMGLGFARYVLRLEALADASPDDLADWVGPTLDRYIAAGEGGR